MHTGLRRLSLISTKCNLTRQSDFTGLNNFHHSNTEEDPSIVFQLSLSDSPGALEFITAFIGCDPKRAIESSRHLSRFLTWHHTHIPCNLSVILDVINPRLLEKNFFCIFSCFSENAQTIMTLRTFFLKKCRFKALLCWLDNQLF